MKKIVLKASCGQTNIWVGAQGNTFLNGSFLGEISEKSVKKAFILSDSNLKSYSSQLGGRLKKCGWNVKTLVIQPSEKSKSIEGVLPIYEGLLKRGADRSSVIFALGGGVIGDLAGFVAGTYMRGIRWVGVPTTLLAQVDSSVGGKTAINHPLGKNLIGVFHQPTSVWCNPDFLKSLPRRELISGLGEMIKYGLILDAPLYRELQDSWQDILNFKGKSDENTLLERWICRCLKWKAKLVAKDEFDQNGIREVLNFGHTVGHALEAETGYQYFRHGEAVIWGMRAACHLSAIEGYLKPSAFKEVESFLSKLPIPLVPQGISVKKLITRLRWDKKYRNGSYNFVLLEKIGKAVTRKEVQMGSLNEALHEVLKRSAKKKH